MKKIFIILTFFTTYIYCADNTEKNIVKKVENKPNLSLNSQDAPVFCEDNNPLTNMRVFHLILPFSLMDCEIQKRTQNVIEKELETIGEVIHLKDHDMRGFASDNILVIQKGHVIEWNGNEMPISRVSLQVETSAVLTKTRIKTFPVVWSINTFFGEPPDSHSDDRMLKAVQKLVNDFVQNYQHANQKQKKKAVFYIYD